MEKNLSKLIEILDIDFHSKKAKLLIWFGGILFLILVVFGVGFYYFYKKSVILSYENRFSKIATLIKNYKQVKHYEIKTLNKKIKKDKFYIKFKDETFDAFYLVKMGDKTIQIAKYNIDNKIETIEDSLLVTIPMLLLILLVLASIMIDKILNPIKQFNSDISHELKTPLSVIKAQIKIIDDSRFDIIKQEIENLEFLINELLILSKYDKTNISKTFKKVSLDSVLIDVLSKFDDRIEIERLEYIECFVNETLLKSVFLNVIDNALKYSEKAIRISLYRDKNICFVVEDFGIGVAENEINKLTNRLYRVDTSRHQKGYGLGLSIVEKVMNLHNGRLEINSILHQGTVVKLIFKV